MKRNKNIGWIGLFLCASLLGAPFTDNGNGTVTDSATGLVWQKCSAGRAALDCSGSATTYLWLNAISYCNDLILGGRSDWRLPNVNELRSILDITKVSSPLIDSTTFPSTESNFYWSSTTRASDVTYVYMINFIDGKVNANGNKGSSVHLRCVTGN
jgi:hypothetical protein